MARVCPDNIDSIKLFRKHGLWQNFRNRLSFAMARVRTRQNKRDV